jgi:hypothetical protein
MSLTKFLCSTLLAAYIAVAAPSSTEAKEDQPETNINRNYEINARKE